MLNSYLKRGFQECFKMMKNAFFKRSDIFWDRKITSAIFFLQKYARKVVLGQSLSPHSHTERQNDLYFHYKVLLSEEC